MLWRLVWRTTVLIRKMPRPVGRVIARMLIGVSRFGTTRLHYGGRAIGWGVLVRDFGMRMVVGPGVYILGAEELTLGDDVSLNHYCYVDASGLVNIGSGSRIGNHSTLVSGNHDMSAMGITRSPIIVGTDVWIGAGCRVLAGTTIGNGAVVGAGAVVSRDVEPGSTVVGVPARPLI